MPVPINLTLTGAKQGKIQGSCTIKGRENTILVEGVEHNIEIPRSPQTGLPTGKRVHGPLTLTKEIDKSSPKLFQALCTGEQMTNVEIDWYRISKEGVEEKYFTTKLQNAIIVDLRTWMPNALKPDDQQLGHMENVSLTYEKIIWTWVKDGIETEDSWTGN